MPRPFPANPSHAILLVFLVSALAMAGCGNTSDTSAADAAANQKATAAAKAFAMEEHKWRADRVERLLKPDGWASLIGLHWIDPGSHYLGSVGDNGIRLQMGPPHLGMLDLEDKQVRFVPDRRATLTLDGEPLTAPIQLRTDMAEQGPSVIGFDEGKGQATVIERGGRYALRVKHADAPTRTGFAGLQYWPADASWKIQGTFVPNPPGQTIEINSIIGTIDQVPNPGRIEFQRDGKTYRIEAQDEGGDDLFLVFADRTNGHGSYGAGRFLYTAKPDANGKVMVDFNQSYNPPCAFTDFATCPLPPPENRLDLAITAGEKAYDKPGHP